MTKVQKSMLFFILMLIIIFYVLWNNPKDKESIPIEPIKIAPLVIKEQAYTTKEYKDEPSETILAKLKIATELSRKNITFSKKQEHNEIIANLQQTIEQQETNKSIQEEKSEIKQKISAPPKVILKKIVTKPKKIISKNIVLKKEPNPLPNKPQEILNEKPKNLPKLSREEEVALYKSKYLNTLEVVNTSESFEIEEAESHLPDSHYFDPIRTVKGSENQSSLKFVEKLGVVKVSNQYEKNFTIPQKIELAEEGLINVSNTSPETEELKNLNFVNTLGVVEVSKDFETTEAQNYLEE